MNFKFEGAESSPRPWGCFWNVFFDSGPVQVFPTPVGVFLEQDRLDIPCICLPHARGGVSPKYIMGFVNITSSPRPWGCFLKRRDIDAFKKVFPTPVGVFLMAEQEKAANESLPHARGGVSPSARFWIDIRGSSPRPWGCFPRGIVLPECVEVFPTPVGVFLS